MRSRLFVILVLLLTVGGGAQVKEQRTVRFVVEPPDAEVYVRKANQEQGNYLGPASEPLPLERQAVFGEDDEAYFDFKVAGRQTATYGVVHWNDLSDGKVVETGLRLQPIPGNWSLIVGDLLRDNPWLLAALGLLITGGAGLAGWTLKQRGVAQHQKDVQKTIDIFQERGLEGLPRFGDYILLKQIGAGGMAVVYQAVKADQPEVDSDVALKRMNAKLAAQDPKFEARFRREIRTLSRLNHPSVIRVFDYGDVDGELYLTMELLNGQDLESLFQQTGPLEPGLVGELISQAARGLQHAHQQGLIHRDVKGENIFYTREGGVKVIDFGLARKAQDSIAVTRAGEGRAGTPGYFPPESQQMNDEEAELRYLTQAYDQFSLAALAFRLLTGEQAFKEPQGFGQIPSPLYCLFYQELHSVREFRPELPAALDQVFEKGLAREPEQRYPSVVEFATSLSAALS